MSMFLRDEIRPNAGFMLIEVLVALGIALLFIVVFARGFSTAWSRARMPAEMTWALALAREVAADIRNGADPDAGAISQFSYETDVEPLTIETFDSTLPPAPRSLSGNPNSAQQKPMRQGNLQSIKVTVTGPSGRKYDYDSIKLDLLQDEN
jgi:hypothetical protein